MSLVQSSTGGRWRTALLLSVTAAVLSSAAASAQVAPTGKAADSTQKKVTKPTTRRRAGVATSTVRIPVSKEPTAAPAPPAPPPINQDSIDRANRMRDSLAAAARESAERARQDSIARAEEARRAAQAAAERARQDSIARAEENARQLAIRRGRYGFYWGIAAGPSLPMSNFDNGYKVGYNVTVPFGWDFVDSPLGIRLDAAYDVMTGKSFVGYDNTDAAVWSLNGDAKLRMRVPPLGSATRLYVVGGGGMHRIVANGGSTPSSSGVVSGPSNNGFATSFNDASTKFSWNAGAGMSFGFGRSAVFLESRYIGVNSDATSTFGGNAHFLPIILGLTF